MSRGHVQGHANFRWVQHMSKQFLMYGHMDTVGSHARRQVSAFGAFCGPSCCWQPGTQFNHGPQTYCGRFDAVVGFGESHRAQDSHLMNFIPIPKSTPTKSHQFPLDLLLLIGQVPIPILRRQFQHSYANPTTAL